MKTAGAPDGSESKTTSTGSPSHERVRPRYTLARLLEGHVPGEPLSDELRAWDEAPPVGRELW